MDFWLGGGGVGLSIAPVSSLNLGYPKSSFLIGFKPLVFRHSPDTMNISKTKKKKNREMVGHLDLAHVFV